MMLACLVNGEISNYVRADDRGLAYGDGLFETLAVRRGKPRFWQRHMDRLAEGCQRLGIGMPPQALLLREVRTVSAGQALCVVKIILTRGGSVRGYRTEGAGPPCRVVSAHAFPQDTARQAIHGVTARTCSVRLAVQPALGGLKHLNRLEQVLAAVELAEQPGVEGILLDNDGHIISALAGNLFLASGSSLLTPRMDRCGVRGVLRGMILRDFKARCELRRITPDMLAEASEVFLCNVVRGVIPVIRIDAQEWPIGPTTRSLQEWFVGVADQA